MEKQLLLTYDGKIHKYLRCLHPKVLALLTEVTYSRYMLVCDIPRHALHVTHQYTSFHASTGVRETYTHYNAQKSRLP